MIDPSSEIKSECAPLIDCRLPDELPNPYSAQRLTGDASSRSYFRIKTPAGKTIVLMKMPEPFDEQDFPYLENYRLFRSLGVRLAEVYLTAPPLGQVFLEDLGDYTFYELYHQWDDATRLKYYLQAVDYLACIEPGQAVKGLSFDYDKFLWEMHYFRDHFLCALRGVQIEPGRMNELELWFARIARDLDTRPRVFCHRDYHSRNLMVLDERVYVIDFQDARFGPTTYDLASFCYDSYVEHAPEFLGTLERYFFARHSAPEFEQYEYPRMCLQRNLKALGTFGFQVTRMDRDFYLQFVDRTLGYVREHFRKLPEYADFRRLLASMLPEIG